MNDPGNAPGKTSAIDEASSAPCRCAVCRAAFPSAKGFRRRSAGIRKVQFLCPGCMNRRVESVLSGIQVFFVVMTIFGIILCLHKVSEGTALLFLGTSYLSLIPCAVSHELGHAFAVLVLGMRLFTVTIGGAATRIVLIRRTFGYDFVLHRNPTGGSVLYGFKNLRFVRLKRFLTVLSGPMANALLIVVAMALRDRTSSHGMFVCVVDGFLCGNAITVAVSLLPLRYRSRNQQHRTDGWQLLTIPFMSRKSIEDWHSATFYYEAMEALQRDQVRDAEQWVAKGMEAYPDNSWGLVVQASILTHQQKYALAKDRYHDALNQREMTPELRANLWNNIAWMDLMLADPTLLEEADRYSRQALEELPWQPYVRGTRGCVLIELGQIDEGVLHVEQAFRDNYMGSSKALSACYLAIAEVRRGDFSKALDYIDDAKKRDPKCPLVARAVEELDRRPQTSEVDFH